MNMLADAAMPVGVAALGTPKLWGAWPLLDPLDPLMSLTVLVPTGALEVVLPVGALALEPLLPLVTLAASHGATIDEHSTPVVATSHTCPRASPLCNSTRQSPEHPVAWAAWFMTLSQSGVVTSAHALTC